MTPTTTASALAILANSRIASSTAHNPSNMPPIASSTARNRRHVARIVNIAILEFARIVSALVVVVGVTSHLGSGAAHSPRRCRIERRCSQSHRDATIARSAAPNPSTSRIESEAALNPSVLQKKVHQLRDKLSRSDSLKIKGGWVGAPCRAPARPYHGGFPSTARPSHSGGRASGTWRNTDRRLLARCPRRKWLTSACARRQCLPLSLVEPTAIPFLLLSVLVCACWGSRRLQVKLPPAGVLRDIKILPYKEANGTERNSRCCAKSKENNTVLMKRAYEARACTA